MTPDLKIANLGPHTTTTLALLAHDGVSDARGGSESGKSTMIDALCLLLTGTARDGKDFAREMIRDGADGCEVKAAIPGVGTARVTLTRRGSWTRQLSIDGATESFTSHAAYAAKLGRIGQVPALVRFVLAPMLWTGLADKELGRPFRDLLLSALPPVDSRAVVAGLVEKAKHTLKDGDVLELAAALKAQTAANSALDRAIGRADAVRDAVARLPEAVEAPDADALAAALAVLAARDEWAAYGNATASISRAIADAERIEERRAALTARANAALPTGPADSDVSAARAVLAAAETWSEYDHAVQDHGDFARYRAKEEAERERRVKARADLGARPQPPDSAALAAVEERIKKAGPAIDDLRALLDKARSDLAIAEKDAERLAKESSECPTCHRTGWDGHALALADARARMDVGAIAVPRETSRIARAEKTLADLQKQAADLRNAADLVAAYDRNLTAIGPDPVVPEARPEPVKPSVARPDADRIEWANGILTAETEAVGARRAAEADKQKAAAELATIQPVTVPNAPEKPAAAQPTPEAIAHAESVKAQSVAAQSNAARIADERTRAQAELTAATAAHEAAKVEADRVSAIVAALRQAPSIIADEQRAKFGDLGPVSLRFPPDEGRNTPAIEVLIDGRPWSLASEGRRILADLHLRAAVRRVAGLDVLPIFVDSAQSWSGAYPEIARVVYLWTTEGADPLTVECVPAAVGAA